MLRRRVLLASAAAPAAPALVARASLGQTPRKVKLGSAFTTTTNAVFLMPALLRPEGIDAKVVTFPSLVQRMQAVASGSVDVGNGGLSATMQVATKGFPMSVLASGCDGGWMMLARPGITGFQQLRGKKVGVQNGSIAREPDLVRTLVRAHVKATERMPTDSSIAVETTVEQFHIGRDIAEASTKPLFFQCK